MVINRIIGTTAFSTTNGTPPPLRPSNGSLNRLPVVSPAASLGVLTPENSGNAVLNARSFAKDTVAML
jgi:hypothetical protein